MSIEKKLFKKGWLGIIASVFALVTVAFLVLAGITGLKETSQTPEAFDPIYSAENKYCYLDVYAVDGEWVAQRDTDYFYTVFDEEGYCYIMIISDSQLQKLSHQIAVFNGTEEDALPYQIKGVAYAAEADLISIYAEVYGISEEEVYGYFGYYYLDTTQGAISDNSISYLWLIGALFSALFAALFFMIYMPIRRSFKKCMNLVSQNWDIEKCERELEELNDQKILLGSDYLYCKENPMVVKYSDILWVYEQAQRYYGIKVSSSLFINTASCGTLIIGLKNKDHLYDEILKTIFDKNPEVMIGYNREYAKAYKEMTKKK